MGSGKELLYVCGSPECEYESSKTELQEHVSKKHSTATDLYCKTCWSKFSAVNKFLGHSCNVARGSAACGALGCPVRTNYKSLYTHILTEHKGVDGLLCKDCMYSFDHPVKFMSHVVTVCSRRHDDKTRNEPNRQNERLLQCVVQKCNVVTSNLHDLIEHVESVHPSCEKLTCKKCSVDHPNVKSLIQHYLETDSCHSAKTSEGKEKAVVACGHPDCKEEVALCKLVNHIIACHPGKQRFVCKRCNLSFRDVNVFATHVKSCWVQAKKGAKLQLGFYPSYRCFYCKRTFNNYEEYEFHHKETHPAKEQTVQLWSVGFNKYTRRPGVDPKTVKNEFTCANCAAQMASEQTLMKHILIIHRQYCCLRCGILCDTDLALIEHRKEAHLKFEEAKVQEEKLKKRRRLEESARLLAQARKAIAVKRSKPATAQDFECYLCSLMFDKKWNLQMHALSRHKVYICHYCEFASSGPSAQDDLKRHHVAVHKHTTSMAHPGVADISVPFTALIQKECQVPPPAQKVDAVCGEGSSSPPTKSTVQNCVSSTSPSIPTKSKSTENDITNLSHMVSKAQCRICCRYFPTNYVALEHICKEHKAYYVCRHCHFRCTVVAWMEIHCRIHHGSKAPDFFRIGEYVLNSISKDAPVVQGKGSEALKLTLSVATPESARTTGAVQTTRHNVDLELRRSPQEVPMSPPLDRSKEGKGASRDGMIKAIPRTACKEQHMCQRCREDFSEKHILYQHMAEEHRLRCFCKYCNFGTTQTQVLFAHLVKEHNGLEFRYIALQAGILVELEESPSPQILQKVLKDQTKLNEAFETESINSDLTGSNRGSEHSECTTVSEWCPDDEDEDVRIPKSSVAQRVRYRIVDSSSDSEKKSVVGERLKDKCSAEDVNVPPANEDDKKQSTLGTVKGEIECSEIVSQSEDEEFLSSADIMKELHNSMTEGHLKHDKGPDEDCKSFASQPLGSTPLESAVSTNGAAVQVKEQLPEVETDSNSIMIKKEVTASLMELEVAIDSVTAKQAVADDVSETVPVDTQELDSIEYKSVLVEGKMCIENTKVVLVKNESQGCHEEEMKIDMEETLQIPDAPLKVFGGYRVPKTASAFQKLLENIGDTYKCCEFSCSYSTMFSPNFVEHLRQHKEVQLFCIYCGVIIRDALELVLHLNLKHRHCTLQCTACLYRGSTNEHINCHFAHAHPNKPADFVEIVIVKTSEKLVENLVQTEERQPYYCGFRKCKFNTMKTTDFVDHVRSAHPDEPSYPCPLCNDQVTDVSNLVSHFQEHGINNIQCAYCKHCSVTIGGIILHLCYCHPDACVKFFFRSGDLEREFVKVLNDSEYVLPHYFVDLVREKSATMRRDLEHIILQQQCPSCSIWCRGFRIFKSHVLAEHRLVVNSHQLAEILFQSYGYRDAVQWGRCPFCSFVAETTAELQEHVLDEELVYAPYECHMCMRTYRTEKDLDEHLFDKHVDEQKLVFHNPDSQLLSWVKDNIAIENRDVAALFDIANLSCLSSDIYCTSQSTGPRDKLAGNVKAEPTLQVGAVFSVQDCESSLKTEDFVTGKYRCEACGFTTFSKTNFTKHILSCDGSSITDNLHFVDRHSSTCSVPWKQALDTKHFVQEIPRVKQSLGRVIVRENNTALDSEKRRDHLKRALEVPYRPQPLYAEEFSFYNTEITPLDHTQVLVQTEFGEVPLSSFLDQASFEPYVLVKDIKNSLL